MPSTLIFSVLAVLVTFIVLRPKFSIVIIAIVIGFIFLPQTDFVAKRCSTLLSSELKIVSIVKMVNIKSFLDACL